MVTGIGRVAPSLVRVILRVDDGALPVAELWRRVGRAADRAGLTRPGYERIRQVVQALRRLKARRFALTSRSRATVGLRGFSVSLDLGGGLELARQGDDPRIRGPASARAP